MTYKVSYRPPASSLNSLVTDVLAPYIEPAPNEGPQYKIRFRNRSEIKLAKRAAKKLHMSFNTYVLTLVMEHSEKVLQNGKSKRK